MRNTLSNTGYSLAAALLVALPLPVFAQEAGAETAPVIAVELNSTLQFDETCQLTFMFKNGLEADVTSLVFETVLLTKEGAVERLTLFDMRDLPSGTPRVRQFNVPSLTCDALGTVLINGVADCSIAQEEADTCTQALDYSSRVEVEILG